MKTIPEIIESHLAPWYAAPPSHVPGVTPTLRDVCAAMIEEALAQAEKANHINHPPFIRDCSPAGARGMEGA